jgi:hypothetical protein
MSGVGVVADAGDRQADLAHGWMSLVAVTTGFGDGRDGLLLGDALRERT